MQLLRRLLSFRARFDEKNDPPLTADTVLRKSASKSKDIIERATYLVAKGRCAAAMSIIVAALESSPTDLELLFTRASTLLSWGRYREGRDELIALAARGLTGFELHLKLGWASYWSGDLENCERWMRLALEDKPDDWTAHFGLGTAFHALKKSEQGRSCFERALELNPDDPYCIANLLGCEMSLGRVEVSESLARRAVEIDSASAVAWSNLGAVLDHQDRYVEAIAAFQKAEEISENAGEVQYDFVNFVVCLFRDGRTNEGIEFLENRLREYPSVMAHSHYALMLLLAGRTDEGFDQYEFRWLDGPLKATRSNFSKPIWNGQNLDGKIILLRAEQGYGDFIQFIRYAPHVKALGATVLLYLPELVRKLADDFDGIDHVLLPDEPLPPFDFFVNLLSLPRIFGADVSSVPADVPYLRVDSNRAAHWAAQFDDGEAINVGLVWAGSPTHLRDKFRSLTIEQLEPLGSVPKLRLFSLQKGPASAQLNGQSTGLKLVNLAPQLDDFVDTAAAVSQMDLVVCVDTSVAHLAGALGMPVWLMLPHPADWRWGESAHATHWYPTMRIFRQSRAGEWSDVIARVTDALREFVDERVQVGAHAIHSTKATSHRRLDVKPRAARVQKKDLSAATYTRVGMLQYWPDESPVGSSVEYYGEYLQPQLDAIGRMLQPGATVMEIGTGIGVHALYLGKAIGPTGHLMLYESRAKMEKVLRQNLAANDIAHVTIMRNEVHGPKKDNLGQGEDTIGCNSTLPPEVVASRFETIDELQLTRLNWLKVNEHRNPIGVIRGAASTLWRLRPMLFTSAAHEAVLLEMASELRAFSYRTWKISTPLFSPVNFNGRGDDIFFGEAALALLAIPEEIVMDIVISDCVEVH